MKDVYTGLRTLGLMILEITSIVIKKRCLNDLRYPLKWECGGRSRKKIDTFYKNPKV